MAQQLHYHVLDMEAMAAQLTADSLLTDMTHPGPDFNDTGGAFLFFLLSMFSRFSLGELDMLSAGHAVAMHALADNELSQ